MPEFSALAPLLRANEGLRRLSAGGITIEAGEGIKAERNGLIWSKFVLSSAPLVIAN
jgi:hypothetical protein